MTRNYTISAGSNHLTGTSIGSTGTGTESYTYDARGNIVSGFNHLTTMTYNELNRLEKVINAGGVITTYYQYDRAGQRVRKTTVNGTNTKMRKYVDLWEVYTDITGLVTNANRETLHIMDDSARVALIDTPILVPLGEMQNLRYQFSNHLGTAALELDYAAAVISYEEYYPCGNTSFQSGRTSAEVSLKRYRYVGKERDSESGFYYIGAVLCALAGAVGGLRPYK